MKVRIINILDASGADRPQKQSAQCLLIEEEGEQTLLIIPNRERARAEVVPWNPSTTNHEMLGEVDLLCPCSCSLQEVQELAIAARAVMKEGAGEPSYDFFNEFGDEILILTNGASLV